MRKPAFCICENKDADQLRGNCEADQRLCFRYTDSTIPLLPKSKISSPLAIFCNCTARFVSDLVGNPEDRFSHNEAHICYLTGSWYVYWGVLLFDSLPTAAPGDGPAPTDGGGGWVQEVQSPHLPACGHV